MTGMKQGAGENPFDEDADPVDEEDDEQSTDATNELEDPAVSSDSDFEDNTMSGSQAGKRQQSIQIPYKFRRNGVQDGRDRVPLFLQSETKSAERDALRDLEKRLDNDVSLTDLREALVKVGLEHLDEVEVQLEEWGYGMTFDQ